MVRISLVEVIDSNVGVNSLPSEITSTTSKFAMNCFNCLNWENSSWPDYTKFTQCFCPNSIYKGLYRSSDQNCDKFSW